MFFGLYQIFLSYASVFRKFVLFLLTYQYIDPTKEKRSNHNIFISWHYDLISFLLSYYYISHWTVNIFSFFEQDSQANTVHRTCISRRYLPPRLYIWEDFHYKSDRYIFAGRNTPQAPVCKMHLLHIASCILRSCHRDDTDKIPLLAFDWESAPYP